MGEPPAPSPAVIRRPRWITLRRSARASASEDDPCSAPGTPCSASRAPPQPRPLAGWSPVSATRFAPAAATRTLPELRNSRFVGAIEGHEAA